MVSKYCNLWQEWCGFDTLKKSLIDVNIGQWQATCNFLELKIQSRSLTQHIFPFHRSVSLINAIRRKNDLEENTASGTCPQRLIQYLSCSRRPIKNRTFQFLSQFKLTIWTGFPFVVLCRPVLVFFLKFFPQDTVYIMAPQNIAFFCFFTFFGISLTAISIIKSDAFSGAFKVSKYNSRQVFKLFFLSLRTFIHLQIICCALCLKAFG